MNLLPGASVGDFSCYVTVLNRSAALLAQMTSALDSGEFTTRPADSILPGHEAYFMAEASDSGGPEGTVTYQVEGGGTITLRFACPYLEDNDLGVPTNNSRLGVSRYGALGYVQWGPNGENWGTENNFPLRGHPLSVLFVIDGT